jgi:hypothetical protein
MTCHPVRAQAPTAPAQIDLVQAAQYHLQRAGLSPDILAAAGLTPAHVHELVNRYATFVVANPGLLSTRETALRSARDGLKTLIVRSMSKPWPTMQADLDAARLNVTLAESQNRATLDSLFSGCVSHLAPEVVSRLTLARTMVDEGLPVVFIFTSRTRSQINQLRAALAAESSDRSSPAHDSLLANTRAEASTAQATAFLASSGEIVRQTYASAVSSIADQVPSP